MSSTPNAKPQLSTSESPGEIRIPNRATYWPVAPVDLLLGAPLVARLLLGASPLGRVLQAAALGAYLESAIQDWRARRGIRRIDFRREFGADVDQLVPMPAEVRLAEIRLLVGRLNAEFVEQRASRPATAVEVDRHLTDYIAGITGQHVRTSVEVRGFALAGLAFPFALGLCDMLTGDVAILRDTGPFEPHIITHEFAHRKGYWKELHAQVLAYLSLADSAHPALRQSALLERLHRQLRVVSGGEVAEFNQLVSVTELRPELRDALLQPRLPSNGLGRRMALSTRGLYDWRLRLTGQNGISDYDVGFTNFLYTFETSPVARQKAPRI